MCTAYLFTHDRAADPSPAGSALSRSLSTAGDRIEYNNKIMREARAEHFMTSTMHFHIVTLTLLLYACHTRFWYLDITTEGLHRLGMGEVGLGTSE